MFALISSRSGSQSAMLLRWALQGHHGPLVSTCSCLESFTLLIFMKDCITSFQNLFCTLLIIFSIYLVLHAANFFMSVSDLIKCCHLQSLSKILLIHVNFRAPIKAFRFSIFNLPSQYCFVTIVVLILLGLLFHKKLYRMILMYSSTAWFGFGLGRAYYK